MDATKLKELLSSGETSKVQFKEKMPHANKRSGNLLADDWQKQLPK